MSKKKLTIHVNSLEETAQDFINVWHQTESYNLPKKLPIEKISFSDERLLFKTLTPRRCDLLRYLHEHGKISIRALAKGVDRDYSNVHQNVKTLLKIGLILKDKKSDKYYMPWDVIVTEIPMFHDHANRYTSHKRHDSNTPSQAAHR